ncbi:MAG: ABC transporter permease [Ignavibacteriaceae bacterium]
MLKNYTKVAFRNLLRSKVYSFINITGLAAGMCCSILILLWVQDELSFNMFHEDIEHTFIVPQTQYYAGGREFKVYNSSAPLGPALKAEYPEVIYSARFAPYMGEMLVQYNNNSFIEEIKYADADFFRIFSFPFIAGDKNNAFTQVHSLVLTEKTAQKYFGSENPVGKTLRLNTQYNFIVSGVVKDVPKNSDFVFDVVLPFEFIAETGTKLDEWFSNSYWTFVKLKPEVNWKDFSAKIKDRLKKEDSEAKNDLFLFPVKDMHLYTLDGTNQQIEKVKLFSVIAFAVLLIACINFMNLATARSAKRSKEVGLRKVVGANRSQLVKQFFSESVLLTLLAMFIAILLVEILLPGFNDLSGKELQIQYFSNSFIFIIIGVTLLTGIIAGSYPAVFLSSFNPIKVLKENLNTGKKGTILRRALVIVQFSLSIILLISTIVVYSQLSFMKNKELGYNKENILYVPVKGSLQNKYDVFRETLLKNKFVVDVASASHRPSQYGTNGSGFEWDGKSPDEDVLITFVGSDENYASVFDFKLSEGRYFSREFGSDSINGVVINEKLAGLIGDGLVVGKFIRRGDDNYQIIGVLKDFHFNTVKVAIEPLIIFNTKQWSNFVFVKVEGENTSSALSYIEEMHSNINPDYPFEYRFLDAEYDKLFRSEERQGKLYNYFAILAVLISALGLFGLASFMAEQRRKEIGVRKVLGSSIFQIIILLSKSFAGLVLIANIIAWPLAYFFMKDWLESFAYRTEINPGFFILSGFIAFLIALTAVSYQAYKAAKTNPVNTLKYE